MRTDSITPPTTMCPNVLSSARQQESFKILPSEPAREYEDGEREAGDEVVVEGRE